MARQKQLHTIDATCPLVTKVHLEAIHYAKQGYTIILVGHHDHDETVGTLGEAPDAIRLVETKEDAEKITVPDPDRVAYLTQTTLSIDDTREILEVLKRRFPNLKAPSKQDICYATQNRQDAVKAMAPHVDMLLVLERQFLELPADVRGRPGQRRRVAPHREGARHPARVARGRPGPRPDGLGFRSRDPGPGGRDVRPRTARSPIRRRVRDGEGRRVLPLPQELKALLPVKV